MQGLPAANPGAEVALPAKVAFLKQPHSYPHPVTEVTVVETHRSWVFLTDQHAYKLKKPGRYAFLDVSTVSARKFYRASAPVEIAPMDYRGGFERDIRASLGELSRPVFGLRRDLVEAPCASQLKLLSQAPALFDQRVQDGRIIEAHGDLRPEHVCLLEPEPVIIDCLEFSRELRTLDAAADLAFLAQECERLGAPRVGPIVFEIYREVTHDRPPATLISFYKSRWACLRAKLCAWHLTDPTCRDPAKWSGLAADYLIRAGRYAADF